MPLVGEAVTLAGPIKGVTLDVATARGAVHGSGEVVFRRWNGWTLAGTWVPPVSFLRRHERAGYRITRLLTPLPADGVSIDPRGCCSILARLDVPGFGTTPVLERVGRILGTRCPLRLQLLANFAYHVGKRAKFGSIHSVVGFRRALRTSLADADEWSSSLSCRCLRPPKAHGSCLVQCSSVYASSGCWRSRLQGSRWPEWPSGFSA